MGRVQSDTWHFFKGKFENCTITKILIKMFLFISFTIMSKQVCAFKENAFASNMVI